jgi:hypothetical protein
LRDVDLGPLGTGHHHCLEIVELGEGTLSRTTSAITSVVEDLIDFILEGLAESVSRLVLQLVSMGLLDNIDHVLLCLANGLLDVLVSFLVSNCVP